MLELSLNGEALNLPLGSVLADAIDAGEFQGEKIAAAINGEFVPRSAYASTELQDRDSIDIVKPVGGG